MKRLGMILGAVASVTSALAVVPSSAPFTAAVYVVLPALPMAIAAIAMGAWRLGVVAIYFCVSCLLVSPMVWNPDVRIDYFMAALIGLGLVLSAALLTHYLMNRQIEHA